MAEKYSKNGILIEKTNTGKELNNASVNLRFEKLKTPVKDNISKWTEAMKEKVKGLPAVAQGILQYTGPSERLSFVVAVQICREMIKMQLSSKLGIIDLDGNSDDYYNQVRLVELCASAIFYAVGMRTGSGCFGDTDAFSAQETPLFTQMVPSGLDSSSCGKNC
jgi:hypothetical protein